MDYFKELDSSQSLYFKRPDIPDEQWDLLIHEYLNPEDHLYFCTSGTSSDAFKVNVLKKEILLGHSKAIVNHFNITSHDRFLLSLPNYFMGGLSIITRAYSCGAKVYECDSFDIKKIIELSDKYKITHLSLVPYQIDELLKNDIKIPSSIKMVLIGGDTLSYDNFKKLKDREDVFYPTYGLSELCSQVATSKLDKFNTFDILPWNKCEVCENKLEITSPYTYSGQFIVNKNSIKFIENNSRTIQTQDSAQIEGNKLKILGRLDRNIKLAGKFINLDQLELEASQYLDEDFFITKELDSRLGSIPVLITKQKISKEILDTISIQKNIIIPEFHYTYSNKLIKRIDYYL